MGPSAREKSYGQVFFAEAPFLFLRVFSHIKMANVA